MFDRTIETGRLILRLHQLEDFEDECALWADDRVVRHIGPPASQEECWGRLLRYIGHWALLGFGFWAVIEKRTGRFVGEVGFMDFKRQIDPPLGDVPEMGWALIPEAQGQGYASEAVAAAQNWADAHFRSRRAVCLIHPDNRASLRVAEKAGFKNPVERCYRDQPTVVLSRGMDGVS
ncbi:N-acetyltransferase [Iodidimonas gelatinilytica]|uniref:N-acetyltransferase n=1 Tax=Iodidimonas gelatinilytica TaxID=1236966 RepID=A0A5A7MZX6_9PROT|nr:GNAT family N-acetyltransferase [Iodidimonas gelatinilytica]GER01553.1 N-acetyltransferase [Iodidimonas gelatinilytica]